MPLAPQTKLLRFLLDSTVERLGSNRRQELDIRAIAATNRNPLDAVRHDHLREDLYYRLNVFSITLPPLRERKDDLEALALHFAAKHCGHGRKPERIDGAVLDCLQAYVWPGNMRELENVMERALVLSGGAPPVSSTSCCSPGPTWCLSPPVCRWARLDRRSICSRRG
ncbi:hypothetical protein D0T25_31900 [Duganella sp. BJB488]|nr:hypothetical protein D0T26_31755 [Duganella sp. BJB489]RFP10942.1 hypothetical protein D0T25_31900 [Duganella sp. BJB488]RFP27860.1 hypothetical protein D0T24_31830 [Duganella sp. BJB480]